jgi:hypothetical protein
MGVHSHPIWRLSPKQHGANILHPNMAAIFAAQPLRRRLGFLNKDSRTKHIRRKRLPGSEQVRVAILLSRNTLV